MVDNWKHPQKKVRVAWWSVAAAELLGVVLSVVLLVLMRRRYHYA